jgi:hypothetical protein
MRCQMAVGQREAAVPKQFVLCFLALAALSVNCKRDCTPVCAHVTEVITKDCSINCDQARTQVQAACVNGDCPAWTSEQADCMQKAEDLAAQGICGLSRTAH